MAFSKDYLGFWADKLKLDSFRFYCGLVQFFPGGISWNAEGLVVDLMFKEAVDNMREFVLISHLIDLKMTTTLRTWDLQFQCMYTCSVLGEPNPASSPHRCYKIVLECFGNNMIVFHQEAAH